MSSIIPARAYESAQLTRIVRPTTANHSCKDPLMRSRSEVSGIITAGGDTRLSEAERARRMRMGTRRQRRCPTDIGCICRGEDSH
jgi:hypothetical protein